MTRDDDISTDQALDPTSQRLSRSRAFRLISLAASVPYDITHDATVERAQAGGVTSERHGVTHHARLHSPSTLNPAGCPERGAR